MTSAPIVLLDACVLANFSLCDTLLRLAEPRRLYEPKWSEEILEETVHTLESKLGWPESLTSYLRSELRAHFSQAWVAGYDPLIPAMTNEASDRHVLAAAVHCGAAAILTFNLRHFQPEYLAPWRVVALHPQAFIIELLRQEPAVIAAKLQEQAADRGRSLPELLKMLDHTVPGFAALVSSVPHRPGAGARRR